ncbi:hypothetical protein [uncultured Subdoligranulum sp.]|uniref:hypothetical protein n=1 Tax=uncultured Subdoligranulum sp. TaxID=512298 RepID=UPI0025FED86D|nr:hypothetical protein [uncultured Subdoligranulum sp.]
MKKKIIIPVVVVILLLVVGLVYMNKSQESNLTPIPTETPAPTATPTPTPEPTPTVTPVSDEGLQYKFDLYVETYKYDNGVTDEDLRNNQDTRYDMFYWIWKSGYTYADAETEQAGGCTNEFVQQYIDWYYGYSNGEIDMGDNEGTNGLSGGWTIDEESGDLMISGDAYESMKEQIEAQGGEILETQEDADRENAEVRENSQSLHESMQNGEADDLLDQLYQQFYEEHGYYPE